MFQNNLLMGAASISAGGITVDNSVLYNDDDSPRLTRTPSSAGNQLAGSISLWYKRGNLGSIMQLFNAGAGDDITFNASDKLTFTDSSGVSYITTQVFRDPTAWGHLLFAWDTTLATAGDRLRIYHNGIEITAFDTETNPSRNDRFEISNTVLQTIGANESGTEEFDGYLSQVYYVDGQQLTSTDFGEFDDNGVWRPIEFSGPSAAGSTPTIAFADSATSSSTATTYTFSGMDIGTASSGREILVGVSGAGADVTLNSVTVGGVAATFVAEQDQAAVLVSLYRAAVPTGTTADVVVVFSANKTSCGVATYECTDLPTFPYDVIGATTSSSTANRSLTVNVPANGTVMGFIVWDANPVATTTWTGITETFDDQVKVNNSQFSGAMSTFGSAQAVTMTMDPSGTNTQESRELAVSWGIKAADYGTNGFKLDFSNSTLLGLDAAGAAASSTTYRYLKLNVTDVTSTGYVSLGEMEYYVGATLYPTQTMTGNSAPSPLVASSDSDTGTGAGLAYLAFDDNINTHWQTANGTVTAYLKIDLGSGNGIAPTSFRLGAPETPDRTPNDFTIQGSNNDSDYTILATYSGFSTPTPTARTFSGYAPITTGNNFVSSGLAAADQVSDTPTNNFCTMSPIDKNTNITLSDGNLTTTGSGSSWHHGRGTLFATSGKWYYEWIPDSGSYALAGWMTNIGSDHNEEEGDPETAQYRGIGGGLGVTLGNQTTITSVANFAVDDVIMMAIDIDTGEVWVGVNGTWEDDEDPGAGGTPVGTWTSFTGTAFAPWTGQFSNANSFNFGQTAFAHTIPTGFSAWSTANLPAPQRIDDVDSQFVGAYDTGTNIVATLNAARNETWTNYINMYRLVSTSGTGANWQFSDDTSNQLTLPGPSPGAKSSFVNPSVTSASGSWNGYTWRVGAEYGVYTAEISHTNGSDTDQAHGLTSDSSRFMAHSKRSDAADEWWIVHPDLSSGNNINFYWAAEVATEYVTVDGTNVTVKATNATGTYRVIVWAEMSGWRKFSKFEGNTNVDGPFLWVGGTPKLHVAKRSTAGEDYHTNLRARDPNGNPMTHQVTFDWTNGETTTMPIDGTAGGVKLRMAPAQANGPAMITWQECTPFGGDGVSPATAV